ncbi:hypothetical protein [Segniliparus rugosus]|uniref:Uncharacterized protein n=1 Tax=Segniliparus rugosus (strain ATCC BAA-974 / DSM 45345 / CCUG 50838 / CIP 108380 / JCM 13579 / CDC 945) TaxID=679197 RepID=E5XQJ8_SEGRC|nr:hypothetical protein [Segniliparus rugosus]EFV13372.1 hypothetical protein HMPREF9336_01761 [Segniliparus rugosus ATCC BAA-974]
MKTSGGEPRRARRERRSAFSAARAIGTAVLSAVAVVGTLPAQPASAEPAPGGQTLGKPASHLPQPWSQREVTEALTQLAGAVRHAKQQAPAKQTPKAPAQQAKLASKTTPFALPEAPEQNNSLDDEEDLPIGMNRGPGYDQILSLALQDPPTAKALHMLAREERASAAAAEADDSDGSDTDGGDDGPPPDPALATVLSLNNGPILYQPPCPFGWPPPDRYGGLADIIELAPMAGDFVSEAFAPAAAWQPMAQLFGPLIAIIQPTIKMNRYWIDPTIINVRNPINAVHYLFFGWYDIWHRQKFLQEEVEWANEVAPWLQQVYQTPQAACFVAFEGMFERLVETGNPWPRGWYVEDHATTWDVDKIGPYEPASPGARPKALQDLDRQLALEDGDEVDESAPKAHPAAPNTPQPAQPPKAPAVAPPQQETPPAAPAPQERTPPQSPPPQAPVQPKPPLDSFPGIDAGMKVR